MKYPREAKKSFWNIVLGVPRERTYPDRPIASHHGVFNDIRLVLAAILDFHLQV